MVPMLSRSKRIKKEPYCRTQRTISDYIGVRKSVQVNKVGLVTPKKRKTFKQAKLAVSGRKFKINEAIDDSYELSGKTAATLKK